MKKESTIGGSEFQDSWPILAAVVFIFAGSPLSDMTYEGSSRLAYDISFC
jgi:hypothetical protein